ncbi:ABC transporter permease [Actinoplanes sp. LDG1-06]|uniref:ABC transporter permease n=1 Tax=Paractinoplanes ovalisporus TaxID=2810368 RepID=A0ABS2AW64_9ACTN|nr:ABC transporter permease [Actinoplanes ovalisporus]MBM2623633.1 ABC transporter permease [Actinoplanes ovalisporus]
MTLLTALQRRSDDPRRRMPPAAVTMAVLVLLTMLACVLVPGLLAPHPPDAVVPEAALLPPGPGHLLGTDELGRDLLSRIIHGSRLSLVVGAAATLLALAAGSLVGLVSGLFGGIVDAVLMRVVDIMLAFPALLLALGAVAVLGSSPTRLAVAVGVSNIATFARLVRGDVLRVRARPYIKAATVSGVRPARLLLRHVLPNIGGPALSLAVLGFGVAMLESSSLSFLGFGPSPPAADWGILAAAGRANLAEAWWLSTFPGVAVAVTVLATTALGRAAQDRLAVQ